MPTILLVDDEDYIRDIFATALREFDVVEASRAADAIELARRQAPDLLITDIRMPDMDGLELVEMVKKLYPNLPTLVISVIYQYTPSESPFEKIQGMPTGH